MKGNKVLYIILWIILFVLIGSSVYVDFISKSVKGVSYILLGQILLGVFSAIATLFLCKNKKNYKVLFIAFLEILFVLGLVILNTVYGYKNLLDITNYNEYMEYVSMNINIYLFLAFNLIIGLLSLDLFIKNNNKNILDKEGE